MNRFKTRASVVSGLGALSVVATITLTGCGAGQQSQTASQQSAVNGSSTNVGDIALRDVRVQAPQTSAEVQAGKTVDLMFVTTNQSQENPDRLLSVSSDIGPVSVSGDAIVHPLGTLLVGSGYRQDATALSAVKPATAVTATVALDKPISNGLLYNFTFTFERAGQATFGVPVTGAENVPQTQQAASAGQAH